MFYFFYLIFAFRNFLREFYREHFESAKKDVSEEVGLGLDLQVGENFYEASGKAARAFNLYVMS